MFKEDGEGEDFEEWRDVIYESNADELVGCLKDGGLLGMDEGVLPK